MSALDDLEKLKISHNMCEDGWYSCPRSDEGCLNKAEGDECTCGAEKHNLMVDALISQLRAELDTYKNMPKHCEHGFNGLCHTCDSKMTVPVKVGDK